MAGRGRGVGTRPEPGCVEREAEGLRRTAAEGTDRIRGAAVDRVLHVVRHEDADAPGKSPAFGVVTRWPGVLARRTGHRQDRRGGGDRRLHGHGRRGVDDLRQPVGRELPADLASCRRADAAVDEHVAAERLAVVGREALGAAPHDADIVSRAAADGVGVTHPEVAGVPSARARVAGAVAYSSRAPNTWPISWASTPSKFAGVKVALS